MVKRPPITETGSRLWPSTNQSIYGGVSPRQYPKQDFLISRPHGVVCLGDQLSLIRFSNLKDGIYFISIAQGGSLLSCQHLLASLFCLWAFANSFWFDFNFSLVLRVNRPMMMRFFTSSGIWAKVMPKRAPQTRVVTKPSPGG
jgi:hypothetical protein